MRDDQIRDAIARAVFSKLGAESEAALLDAALKMKLAVEIADDAMREIERTKEYWPDKP